KGPHRETPRKAHRGRLLFSLEPRQLEVQRREQSKLPRQRLHLRKHAKHEGSLLPFARRLHCFRAGIGSPVLAPQAADAGSISAASTLRPFWATGRVVPRFTSPLAG